MASDEQTELVREIRDLLRIIAEPAIAERDKKLRAELRRVTGGSERRRRAVSLMDGTRLQADIQRETRINQGDLSTFVKALNGARLLSGDLKRPKLAISIPATFFETEGEE